MYTVSRHANPDKGVNGKADLAGLGQSGSAAVDAGTNPALEFVRFFFFNETATTEIYTLSLHDALPIFRLIDAGDVVLATGQEPLVGVAADGRSEEHTSELQSHLNLVCRLLLENKHYRRDGSPPSNVVCRSPDETLPHQIA